MKRHRVRLSDEAVADIAWIYRLVRRKSASTAVARNYVARIREFLTGEIVDGQTFEITSESGEIVGIVPYKSVVRFE